MKVIDLSNCDNKLQLRLIFNKFIIIYDTYHTYYISVLPV